MKRTFSRGGWVLYSEENKTKIRSLCAQSWRRKNNVSTPILKPNKKKKNEGEKEEENLEENASPYIKEKVHDKRTAHCTFAERKKIFGYRQQKVLPVFNESCYFCREGGE